jgi:hypothetical protein
LKKFDGSLHFTPHLYDGGAEKYSLKEKTRIEGPWEFGSMPVRMNNSESRSVLGKRCMEVGVAEAAKEFP